ncbi:MAG: phosphoribosylformylglycinamidine synthase subunit PurS [Thermoproteota archaeon]|jgi:phosphoribosylformylglycinamidine synthase|tara:strand:- start:1046 stop:1315 length:270 start_codon:yes stop_codon:yes gene_type:complete
MSALSLFKITVQILNKSSIKDPEGETIMNELISRAGFNDVKSLRTGKILEVEIESNSLEEAKEQIQKLCDDLRIYNPLVSTITLRGIEE